MHQVFYRPQKNPYLRGFQWVFALFLQVLNEWIFTAFHRSSHRSLFGLMHPIFKAPCISPDRNCTEWHLWNNNYYFLVRRAATI